MSAKSGPVEKIMALALADFHRSVKSLAPGLALDPEQTSVSIRSGENAVAIRFEAQEDTTLGGLLKMPRARVTLTFEGLDEAERATFLARFDKAFQRGGG